MTNSCGVPSLTLPPKEVSLPFVMAEALLEVGSVPLHFPQRGALLALEHHSLFKATLSVAWIPGIFSGISGCSVFLGTPPSLPWPSPPA